MGKIVLVSLVGVMMSAAFWVADYFRTPDKPHRVISAEDMPQVSDLCASYHDLDILIQDKAMSVLTGMAASKSSESTIDIEKCENELNSSSCTGEDLLALSDYLSCMNEQIAEISSERNYDNFIKISQGGGKCGAFKANSLCVNQMMFKAKKATLPH